MHSVIAVSLIRLRSCIKIRLITDIGGRVSMDDCALTNGSVTRENSPL